jgi:hypothetical protein
MRAANDALRFLLELGVLAAVAYWGWWEAHGALRWVLAIGAPLVVAVTWGRFMAPKSPRRVRDPRRLILELLVFGSAVVALARVGDTVGAIVFGALVAAHLTLTFALGQRDFMRCESDVSPARDDARHGGRRQSPCAETTKEACATSRAGSRRRGSSSRS